jgi:hypothetical protein
MTDQIGYTPIVECPKCGRRWQFGFVWYACEVDAPLRDETECPKCHEKVRPVVRELIPTPEGGPIRGKYSS